MPSHEVDGVRLPALDSLGLGPVIVSCLTGVVSLGVWLLVPERVEVALVGGSLTLGALFFVYVGVALARRELRTIPLPRGRAPGSDVNARGDRRAGGIVERIASALESSTAQAEEAERAATEQIGFFQDFVELLPGGTALFDARLRLVQSSEAGLPGPHWSPEGVHPTPRLIWPEADAGDFVERFGRHVERCLEGGSAFDVEQSLPGATGGERHYRYHFLPLRDSTGQVARVAVVGDDVTDRVSTERLLAESQERLRQAEKLEVLGRLVGGVAHDFNNLLTVIRGHGEIGLTDVAEDDPLKEDLQEIVRAATRAGGLTSQLLAFSRKREAKYETLDLNDVLRGAEKLLSRVIGEDIELVLDLAPDLAPVKADLVQIEQIVLNLAVNARDAMATGGSLRVSTTASTEPSESDEKLWPGYALGDAVVLSVTDTGIGMDEETAARVFEPFFTTKGVNRGTGLGLATVSDIVRQTGGFIEMESEPGQGTSFRIFLPTGARADRAGGMSTEHTVRKGDGETVLVVEDEPEVLSLVGKVLSRFGYRILGATTPELALEIFQESAPEIDVVLTDLVMPGMDGLELMRILKEHDPDLPVLLMSGYSDDVLAAHGASCDDDHFLPKPFTATELASRVRSVLDLVTRSGQDTGASSERLPIPSRS